LGRHKFGPIDSAPSHAAEPTGAPVRPSVLGTDDIGRRNPQLIFSSLMRTRWPAVLALLVALSGCATKARSNSATRLKTTRSANRMERSRAMPRTCNAARNSTRRASHRSRQWCGRSACTSAIPGDYISSAAARTERALASGAVLTAGGDRPIASRRPRLVTARA